MFRRFKPTLSHRFMVLSLGILTGGILAIGLLLAQQIKLTVLDRTAHITSLYFESLLSHHLTDLLSAEFRSPSIHDELNELVIETPLGEQFVSFKLWLPDGEVLHSFNEEVTGQVFDNDRVDRAFQGESSAVLTSLEQPEDQSEAQYWDQLIEIYVPIHSSRTNEVIAVAEFYQTPEDLIAHIRQAQLRSWLVVIAATTLMYGLLNSMVSRASNTIEMQKADLTVQVEQLNRLLSQNTALHERVRLAAEANTTSTEQYLRRIAADIHDGPAQDLAFALLRLDSAIQTEETGLDSEDITAINRALQSTLDELRSISSGLRLPELSALSPGETVQRAIRDYEQKSRQSVGTLSLNIKQEDCSLPTKIALYRIVQEALTNGYRHARGARQTVTGESTDRTITVCIRDEGAGFDPMIIGINGHLGLVGMRDRVEMLGGNLSIGSNSGGTTISVELPVNSKPAV